METHTNENSDAPPEPGGAQAEKSGDIEQAPAAEKATARVAEELEAEEEEEEEERRPVGFRIGLPATIVIALLMLLLGAMSGYVTHSFQTAPTLERLAALERQATVTSATATAESAQHAAQQAQAQPTPDMQAILKLLVSKTRHFAGDANAPVTMIEFGDFQ